MSARYLALLVLIAGGSATAQAQEEYPRVRYYNRTSTGILVGGEHYAITGSLTTIHGISTGPLAAGVGVGIEGYQRWRTVPIFGSMSLHFRGARESGAFIQLDLGHSICTLLPLTEGARVQDREGGFMLNALGGYQVAAGKVLITFSGGYKMQKLRGDYTARWLLVDYDLEEDANCLFVQIGVGF